MESLPQMMVSLNPTEVNKLDDQANTETGLLALTKRPGPEYISSNPCKTQDQDTAMAERTCGAETTVPALDQPGEAKVISSKTMLHQVCSANKWKLPEYEWRLEQGPAHMTLFTCKVIVEIRAEEAASSTFLECFSNPMPQKKAATEHASSGAIWYLKQLGYFPPEGKAKSKRRKNNHKKPKTEGVYDSHEPVEISSGFLANF
ncbi:unnamed protein product [Linum trigynum]|uniref:DRBM domain-containing protein n=2 Tax=Linum trigynum TaxID=586398 RepID=A0AAV2DTU9_9ROSI